MSKNPMTVVDPAVAKNPDYANEPLQSLVWIKVLATASSLIALAGLVALFAQNSHAEDNGFTPGANRFAPPPAGAPGTPPPFFDEEDDDDFEDDFEDVAPPSGVAGGTSRGNTPTESPTSSSAGNRSGIQIGGSGTGVVEGARSAAQAAAKVADDGATGSDEVITDFNFPDADIMDIAKALGKLTGKNFILDKEVKGRITIISNSPITVRDAWRAFLTSLDMNNFALIPSGNFIRIARSRDARDKQLKTYTGNFSPDSDALITRVFSLKFLSSEEVARNFRSFMPANSRIIPYEQTNTVIVTDTGSNIAKLSKLLEILDIEGFDAGIEVIAVKHAAASALAELIDKLIPGTTTGGGAGAPRFAGAGGGSRFSARKTKEGGIINTIIADERTNNLIVHANAQGANQIRDLLRKLDKPLPATATGGKVHVVYLQFSDAEQLANTLNGLTAGGGSAATPRSGTGAGAGTGVNPVQQTLFEGAIKLAADKSTNSLVITASPQDFGTLQRVINRLDIPRDQVYAEGYIMEINMTKSFAFSANFFNVSSGLGSLPNGDLASFIASPLAASGAILGFKAGGTKTVTIGSTKTEISSVTGLVQAIQKNDMGNILATPQILTLDNTEAFFESAEKVPVASQSISSTGTTAAGLTDKTVAINMKLKPSINKMSNFVKLEIDAKMEDFSSRGVASGVASQGGIATFSRNVKTQVMVGDGDTVVLGGLTRDKSSDITNKIPLLGDIPVLGWLFKSKASENQKSNLLIFITPKIIRQYEAIRAVLDRKLKERDDFIEGNAGGVDNARSARDRMIRSLPDVHRLQNTKPVTNFSIDRNNEGSMSSSAGSFSDTGRAGAPPPAETNTNSPGANFGQPTQFDGAQFNNPNFPQGNPTFNAPPAGEMLPPPVFDGGSG